MTDLTEFLLARIAEDDAAARAATPGPWQDLDGYVGDMGDGPGRPNIQVTDYGTQDEDDTYAQSGRDSAHIARWDPARVLAECDAKRRIVQAHEPSSHLDGPPACATCCQWDDYPWRVTPDRDGKIPYPDEAWPCLTLRLLALPYADRPGYRDEWRP